MKHGEAGRTVTLSPGDVFLWENHGERDCDITHCSPPLENNQYHVPAGGSTQAKVADNAAKKTYDYSCSCHDLGTKTNPHIIIS
jgi:plastocyanin